MLYYLGTGIEFKKEDCKEYKTEAGAIKAMFKTEDGVVWDETGKKIATATGEKNGGQQEADEQEIAGKDVEVGENGTKEDKVENVLHEKENAVKERNTASHDIENDTGRQNAIIVPQGKVRVMVVCDGTLNLRRSPAWGEANICGRATKGQTYYVKEIYTVDGKKMVRTIDDLYLSGMPEHVQFLDK